MGKARSILFGDKEECGVLIQHIKTRKEIVVSAWWDSAYAGTGDEIISVEEFLTKLGINK